ncbi:hypothetical protein DSO57_1029882 [Entomophthora muscae]|uniref:Uncharacterized protein n=1 Tax=Entomophthora muscae TaxID=34485 RepID=A0ACC2SQ08_9FUNG|nr:hypothetical protein DSO57_1029882 [Entomophthora muscae]
MEPNSGPWSLLGRSLSYIIKLAPILWWALPTGLAAPRPESPNASTYAWLPDIVSDSRRVAITHKTVPFSVRIDNIQLKYLYQ